MHFPLTYIDYIEKDESFIFDIQSLHNILLLKIGEQQDQNEEETQSTRQRKKSLWNFNKNKSTFRFTICTFFVTFLYLLAYIKVNRRVMVYLNKSRPKGE